MGEKQAPALKRSIGIWSAVAINVGAIIGGGIFVVTGVAAGYTGSVLVVSILTAGIVYSLIKKRFRGQKTVLANENNS